MLNQFNSPVVVTEASIDDATFAFINICNPNTETEQLLKLPRLGRLLENRQFVNKNVLMGADFNFQFDSNF